LRAEHPGSRDHRGAEQDGANADDTAKDAITYRHETHLPKGNTCVIQAN